jgi:hypothetical protein
MKTTIEISQWLQDAIVKNLMDIVREEVGDEYWINFDSAEYGVITIECKRRGLRGWEYDCVRRTFDYREALKLYLNGTE